ncbi:hypothetical protein JIN77_09150 [Verrucomicrobiaceae bacterium R5-34]|uniref:Uncharacterized protein n=1 Tax=Oceaniferula flava TaxID=2800421 RepID=A0AAE2SC53_9BACT|nr:hypothetical protein [Oceaniferula flavus]MBK1830891.1 hypothetical protein [Verrucomicrobiaceae bacterium R5-34]MBK1855738.1 hypothetical protein [Oceaniferula flavus]MBM1137045.1 hypothetical protein [Oceaniferula flavus]
MKAPTHTSRSRNTRWFLFLNSAIAVVLVCAAVLMKNNSERFKGQSKIDRTYLAMTKAEQDSSTLQHGILHTEAARATAYRSVLNISNGTAMVWLLISVAFLMNAVFVFRMNRSHQLSLEEAHAA